ncbi:Indigoidine synthase A like protein-domain-containing protein [Xylogone sp. PMI_703]|nr:Indigoidine synthase A like protein-domain-containing protein [Xylogone sp. PMI_703]
MTRLIPLSRAPGFLRTTHHRLLAKNTRYSQLKFHGTQSTLSLSNGTHFKVSEEVQHAIATNTPVVALETTIYTHGFPFPDNVALALELETIVRENGAVPATIGILDGVARVGLTETEVREITSAAAKPETMKVSRRDIPYILGQGLTGRKLTGGTTIAGTMFLANQAGIKVFGTGGLGGVHRGAHITMDVSADLTELGRTPVAVICSGCKSFLDIPRTLEYLETQGVSVATFADGRTGDINFPAFFTRDSGVKSPSIVQNEKEAAAMIFSQTHFTDTSGMLFANPIPEEFAIPKVEIDAAIDQAVIEAAQQGFHGHANTPFILNRIKELTKGNSIPANRALIHSNVLMATKVATELAELHRMYKAMDIDRILNTQKLHGAEKNQDLVFIAKKKDTANTEVSREVDVLVLGSVAVDLSCDYAPKNELGEPIRTEITPQLYTSNVAEISPSIGGVGHNVALATLRASRDATVRLCSFIGNDLAGKAILSSLEEEKLDISGIKTLSTQSGETAIARTAQYVAVNDMNKDLVMAMADMSLFSNPNAPVEDLKREIISSKPKWIVVDGNWHPKSLQAFLEIGKSVGSKAVFEPVSNLKSKNIFPKGRPGQIPHMEAFPNNILHLVTPNQYELASMHAAAKDREYFESDAWWNIIDSLGIPSTGARDRFVALTSSKLTDQGIPFQTIQLLPFIPTILTKLGPEGVLLTELLKPDDYRLRDPKSAPYILSRCNNGSTEVGGVYMRMFPASEEVKDIVSVNGVGDTFLGVLIAGLANGLELDETLIGVAQRGAVLTLRSKEAVSPQVETLKWVLHGMPSVRMRR